LISSRWRKVGCVFLFLAAGVAALAAVFVAASLKMPYDSPLARMYRTEADIASLVRAVELFKEARGEYPPPGLDGLRQATDFISGARAFFPDGPPPDAWGRPYKYVPHTDYDNPDWGAQRCGKSFCAPNAFQIYSAGADGEAGTRDDITPWDKSRPWRPVYNLMHEDFVKRRKSQ